MDQWGSGIMIFLCSPYPTDVTSYFTQDWPSSFSETAENDQKFMINLQWTAIGQVSD